MKPDARPFDPTPDVLVCPAEGRVTVWPETATSGTVRVKGIDAPIRELFQRDIPEFEGGGILVVRLCPADYHRFHFPCDAEIVGGSIRIPGRLDSVHPVALARNPFVFIRNQREYTIWDSRFGRFTMMEIGAFGVGGIVQTHCGKTAKKMDEKGYFKFGASTVLLLFRRGEIEFDSDLVTNTANGQETRIRVGERIGTKK
jgi:phosphatidylserine decarboxylase